MVWQEAIALTIVAMTAAAFVWSRFRPRKFTFQRDTHCGCASASRDFPRQSIVFRARKGERPQITVRLNS
jgi:hypothetical protein